MRTTQPRFDPSCATPIRFAQGNIVVGHDGRSCALYRLPTFSYALLPDPQKWGLLTALASMAFRTEADISIHRVYRRMSAGNYVAQAEDLIDSDFQDVERWREFLKGHEGQIDELDAFAPEVYLRVSQRRPRREAQGTGVRERLDRGYRQLTELLGIGPDSPLTEGALEARVIDEERLLGRVCEIFLDARRATIDELKWLCQRAPIANLAEPDLDPWWVPNAMVVDTDDGLVFKPHSSDWLRLFNASVYRPPGLRSDYLVIDGEGPDGMTVRSYQAFLTVGALPFRVEFPGPGAELMFAPLDGLPWAVDAVFHAENISNEKAIAEVDKAIVDAENAIREAIEGGHTPDNVELLHPEQGRELKDKLASGDHQPMYHGTVSYRVTAPDLAELRRRVDALRRRFSDIVLHQPPALQEQLYYDHLVQPAGGQVPDWRERLTLEQLGMLMPIGDSAVGSPRGVYFGHTIRSRRRIGTPVLIDPLAAAANAETPSMYFMGRQGSGKTFAALLLGLLCAMRGSYVLTADPSPDHHLHELPELEGISQVIDLVGSEHYRGMLDPLVVTPEELREELAISYFLEVLPFSHNKGAWETEITRAVRAVMKRGGGRGGSQAVLKALRDGTDGKPPSEDALQVVAALELIAESGLGILAFGDGANARRFEDLKRVTTISMGNLALPRRDTLREGYQRNERIASATFKLVGAYMMWLVKSADRSIHKYLALDEMWRWRDTSDGEHKLNEILRIGRKFNCSAAVLSQGVDELGPLKKLIGQYFLFGVNDLAEAQLGLQMIGADPEDLTLASRLHDRGDFCKGRCLYRDPFGRIAEMQTDAVFPHVADTLRTEPRATRRAA